MAPFLPGKAALAGSKAATAATPHATNTAKATEATNNRALLLAQGFVALKKSFVAIFSPQLFSTKATNRLPPLLAVAGCTIDSLCPRCPYIRDEVLSLYSKPSFCLRWDTNSKWTVGSVP